MREILTGPICWSLDICIILFYLKISFLQRPLSYDKEKPNVLSPLISHVYVIYFHQYVSICHCPNYKLMHLAWFLAINIVDSVFCFNYSLHLNLGSQSDLQTSCAIILKKWRMGFDDAPLWGHNYLQTLLFNSWLVVFYSIPLCTN